MPVRSRSSALRALAFGVLAVTATVLAANGCSSPRETGVASGDATENVDQGPTARACDSPEEGCPCVFSQEGISMPCGTVASASGSEVECYHGLRTCKAGKWGACDAVGTTTTLALPGVGLQGLGTPSPCAANPCDPYCSNVQDTPVGVDAGPAFKHTPDGGLTLVGGSCAGAPNVDDDGDGWTELEGDCNDCSAVINPGAYDYPGNGFDDDCDGAIDNAPTSCDSGLSLSSSNGADYAKAIDLCKFTTASAVGAAKTWGVITGTPDLVRADANPSRSPGSRQYGIMSYFGNAARNGAKKGDNLAVFSSGRARFPGQSGYIKPKGWCGSSDEGTSSSTPCGFSWNKAGCPAGRAGYDSSGMMLQVRVPTNAQCMSFRFHYLSSEYPEWVCSPYNDSFVAMLKSGAMTPGSGCCGSAPNVNCNISYGASFTPVSVNNNLFSVPGCSSCSSPVLAGTGLDTGCGGYIGGGSTNWLYSHAPVEPGEIATFHTSVWDTGDHEWDSTVLIDAWEWYPGTCTIGTDPDPPTTLPTPPVSAYQSGTYTRDFEAVCLPDEAVVWRLFSWTSMEPLDSKIVFSVQTATTLPGLAAAPSGTLATAQGHASPTAGSADVKPALAAIPATSQRWLRVSMAFSASTNGAAAPTLFDWNQAYDCVPYE